MIKSEIEFSILVCSEKYPSYTLKLVSSLITDYSKEFYCPKINDQNMKTISEINSMIESLEIF
jgi:hypothetical protein